MKFYAIRKILNGNDMWATRSYSRRTSYRVGLDKYTRLYSNLSGAKRSLYFAKKHQSNVDPTKEDPNALIELVELDLLPSKVV